MTFFGFPKVKWLHLTVEVDKCVRVHVKFSHDLTYQKLLKSVKFDSYSKNKKVDVFGTQGTYTGRCYSKGSFSPHRRRWRIISFYSLSGAKCTIRPTRDCLPISIGSSVFADHTGVPNRLQAQTTWRHDLRSNSPHFMLRLRRGLTIWQLWPVRRVTVVCDQTVNENNCQCSILALSKEAVT